MNLFIPWGWGTLSSNWTNFKIIKKLILPKIYNNLKIKKIKKNNLEFKLYILYVSKKKEMYLSFSFYD